MSIERAFGVRPYCKSALDGLTPSLESYNVKREA